MYSNFANYKVKIRPTPFNGKSGVHSKSTAAISFYSENKKEIDYIELAFITTEEIYYKIDNGEDIILDECYIENFSLNDYRKSRKLTDETMIDLNNFSSIGTFYDSRHETDFSYANFLNHQLSFNQSIFINGQVNFHKAKFNDGIKNFINIIFKNGHVDFSNVDFGSGKVDFKNTIFCAGDKDFKHANFGSGDISFVNTEFGKGNVYFINTNFCEGNVSFKVARFNTGDVNFQFAHFKKGDISFEKTEFGEGKVDFRKVEFDEGKVNFNRSKFGKGEIAFDGSQLILSRMTFKKSHLGSGVLTFEEAEYGDSEVLFDDTDFGDCNVYFGKSLFNKLSLTSCQINKHIDFKVSKCNYLNLSDTIVRDIIDFSSYNHTVNISCLNIAGMRLIGQIYIDWFDNNLKNIITKQVETNDIQKAEQFRILKENFSRIGNYKYEDLAYIQFKRYEQKDHLNTILNSSRINLITKYPFHLFKWIVVDKMGLYATSPARVLRSVFIVYLSFSFLHITCPYIMNTAISCIHPESSFIMRVLDTLYYSLITFSTVGYGDCTPTGFLKFIASIEGFIGPFMLSYFTVAFVRKILR
ncbi:MAG: potassium channel family protein [Bacteroidota bacterium]